MNNFRVIPVLLLQKKALVKTIKFKNPKYIGDPINAIKIFNDKEVDELIILDIDASKECRKPDYKLISEVASECFMPLGYGGGISTINQAEHLFNIGIEKVIINSKAVSNPKLITELAKISGNQSVIVSIDIKKNWANKSKLFSYLGNEIPNISIVEFVQQMESLGAGELIINSVDQDGMMNGLDIDLIKDVVDAVNIPVVGCGGAGNVYHLRDVFKSAKASAVAAGSMFVFHGPHQAVLINYPTQKELSAILHKI
jgi:cyclase